MLAAVVALAAVPALASAATLKEEFDFTNSYAGKPATTVPALTSLGTGVDTFVKENVDGAGQRYVLDFAQGDGVAASTVSKTATQLIPSTTWTIALLARLNEDSPSCWRRYVDFTDGTADSGLYQCGGFLDFFPATSTGPTSIDTGWHQIVVTRTAQGLVAGYTDGVQQWTFDDSSTQYGVITADDVLRFFRDNDSGGTSGEDSSGAVSRIRLYNGPLSATAVQYLDRTVPAVKTTPAKGARGAAVHLTGTGFGPNDTVNLSFFDKPSSTTTSLGTATADALGAWSADVTVPATATVGATDKIIAKGTHNKVSVTKSFTVTS